MAKLSLFNSKISTGRLGRGRISSLGTSTQLINLSSNWKLIPGNSTTYGLLTRNDGKSLSLPISIGNTWTIEMRSLHSDLTVASQPINLWNSTNGRGLGIYMGSSIFQGYRYYDTVALGSSGSSTNTTNQTTYCWYVLQLNGTSVTYYKQTATGDSTMGSLIPSTLPVGYQTATYDTVIFGKTNATDNASAGSANTFVGQIDVIRISNIVRYSLATENIPVISQDANTVELITFTDT